jgi:hypothetical protein
MGLLAPVAFGITTTGSFTSPLTSNLLLSVDINGGIIASNNTSTEGTNGPSSSPTLGADSYGVNWSPWGGPISTSGDGTQLPNSNGGGVTGNSISKAFGGITAILSTPGLASNYAQNGTGALNGRDRGVPPGDPANSSPTPVGDGDMFRDFEFAGVSGSNVQSTNYLQLQLTGLTPGGQYQLAVYSFDQSSPNTTAWSALPLLNPGIGETDPTSGMFVQPADEQIISWNSSWSRSASGGTNLGTQAPAVFSMTADGNGDLTVYGWGGTGISGSPNASSSYLDGFQLAAVPEPTSLTLLGVGAFGLLARRRKAC